MGLEVRRMRNRYEREEDIAKRGEESSNVYEKNGKARGVDGGSE